MQPEDISRLWNQEQQRNRRHDNLLAVLMLAGVLVGLGLLSWWTK